MLLKHFLLAGLTALAYAAPATHNAEESVAQAITPLSYECELIEAYNVTLEKRQLPPALRSGSEFRTCFGVMWQAALVTFAHEARPLIPESALTTLTVSIPFDWALVGMTHLDLFDESYAAGATTIATGTQVGWRIDSFWSDNQVNAEAQLASVLVAVVEQAIQGMIQGAFNQVSFNLVDVLSHTVAARFTFWTLNTVGNPGQ